MSPKPAATISAGNNVKLNNPGRIINMESLMLACGSSFWEDLKPDAAGLPVKDDTPAGTISSITSSSAAVKTGLYSNLLMGNAKYSERVKAIKALMDKADPSAEEALRIVLAAPNDPLSPMQPSP